LPSQAERLAWLAEQLATLQGHGIIYTLTVRDANQVADWLKTQDFNVEAYTGETGDRRETLEQALLHNQVKALVATTALGMGYDKPDLAFVIHYQMPGSVIAYYQQVGRAGRALDCAYGVLLSGEEESDITDWFISSAFPTRREVADVLDAPARGTQRPVRSRTAESSESEQRTDREDDCAAFSRIAGTHRQARQPMAAHGRNAERGFLGARGAPHRIAPRRAPANAGLRQPAVW
jgi:superfamily II DNA helicase RecQ